MLGRNPQSAMRKAPWGSQPLAAEDDPQGLENDLDVETEAPGVDVLEVEADPLFAGQLSSSADLPEACDAGLHGESATFPEVEFRDFVGQCGSWADETHVTLEDVPQLWQFIEAESP